MSVLEGLHRYYSIFGPRGVLTISAYRLFGAPNEIVGYPPGVRSPVRLRMRTSDIWIYVQVLLDREYAFDLPFTPETIVDGGANIGMSSVFFANRYPNARIFAVEPEAANYAMLVKNSKAYPSITPIHAALWNRDGHISVFNQVARGESGFRTREQPGGSVPAITMGTLMREAGISRVDLAKLDIEGAEIEVFEDTGWLSGTRCVMIEFHDRFRPGCMEAAELALRDFAVTRNNETACYVRRG